MCRCELTGPKLFIGSSKEGLPVAEHLQATLDEYCEPSVWNQGSFGLSDTTIASLLKQAGRCDYAAFILTSDDLITQRGRIRPAARDNVLFEVGLFIGAIGLERTFLVCCQEDDLMLPSDLDGVTRALYRRRADGNLHTALVRVALQVRQAMKEHGIRRASASPSLPAPAPNTAASAQRPLEEERALLAEELSALTRSAQAQGWVVKTHSSSAYRLVAPDQTRFTLPLGDPYVTRTALRGYAQELADQGLRLSRMLVTPVGQAPAVPAVRSKKTAAPTKPARGAMKG